MLIICSCRIETWVTSANGLALVCGEKSGLLTIRNVWNLEETMSMALTTHGAISSLWFSDDSQFLFIGSEDGSFSIATDPESRWKMMQSNMLKTPLLSQSAL